MDLASLRSYLLSKHGATETYPFGPDALVIKVAGKMFALVAEEAEPLTISLKCDPGHAQFLRSTHPAVTPGYHLNKEHWNTVTLDGSIEDGEIFSYIDESYQLVVKGLTRAARRELEASGSTQASDT